MTSEFKVMPWLRALRDKSAKEQEGLSVAERLRRSRALSAPLMEEFLKSHPEARSASEKPLSQVAEENPKYGGK
jgi:hypothetical protein